MSGLSDMQDTILFDETNLLSISNNQDNFIKNLVSWNEEQNITECISIHPQILETNYTKDISNKRLTVELKQGLGNQLFQLAFLLYLSKKTRLQLFLKTLESPKIKHSKLEYFTTIFQKWKINYSDSEINTVLYENNNLCYESWDEKINILKGNIKVVGYFQRYEYVDTVYDEFVDSLTFDTTILKKYPNISNKFFIHVRGGDYKTNPSFNINLEDYYETCMKKNPDEQFIIFTNDVPYAKKLLPNIEIIEENEVDTLFLMSKCRGCICANSTFSWWGAYLNRNRPIYFPSVWFNVKKIDSTGLHYPGSNIITIFPKKEMVVKKTIRNFFENVRIQNKKLN
jgi:hypothetical protein